MSIKQHMLSGISIGSMLLHFRVPGTFEGHDNFNYAPRPRIHISNSLFVGCAVVAKVHASYDLTFENSSASDGEIFIERFGADQEGVLKVTNNNVSNVDTFYRGPDNESTIIDGNHFRDGKIFLDITSEKPGGNYIITPEGMTREDLRELALEMAKAKSAGRDVIATAERSPWWSKLLANGANAATLTTALVQSGIYILANLARF